MLTSPGQAITLGGSSSYHIHKHCWGERGRSRPLPPASCPSALNPDLTGAGRGEDRRPELSSHKDRAAKGSWTPGGSPDAKSHQQTPGVFHESALASSAHGSDGQTSAPATDKEVYLLHLSRGSTPWDPPPSWVRPTGTLPHWGHQAVRRRKEQDGREGGTSRVHVRAARQHLSLRHCHTWRSEVRGQGAGSIASPWHPGELDPGLSSARGQPAVRGRSWLAGHRASAHATFLCLLLCVHLHPRPRSLEGHRDLGGTTAPQCDSIRGHTLDDCDWRL